MKCGRPEKRGKNTKKKHEGKTARELAHVSFLGILSCLLGPSHRKCLGGKGKDKSESGTAPALRSPRWTESASQGIPVSETA